MNLAIRYSLWNALAFCACLDGAACVSLAVTTDTRYLLTELRGPAGNLSDLRFHEASLLDSGDVVARDTWTNVLYRWVPEVPNGPRGTLHEIPWPSNGPSNGPSVYQGVSDVTPSGRALVSVRTSNTLHQYIWEPSGGIAGIYTPLECGAAVDRPILASLNDMGQFGALFPTSIDGQYAPGVTTCDANGNWSSQILTGLRDNVWVVDINNSGVVIIGTYHVTQSQYSAFRWIPASAAGPAQLNFLPSGSLKQHDPVDINDQGWIITTAWNPSLSPTNFGGTIGYLHRPLPESSRLEAIELFTFGVPRFERTRAKDLNNAGVVVGAGLGGAAIWSESTGDLSLNAMMIAPDEREILLLEGRSINELGQILAHAEVDSDGDYKTQHDRYFSTFLLTPVPEPSGLHLLVWLFPFMRLPRRARRRGADLSSGVFCPSS